MFWGSFGPKSLGKCTACKGQTDAEKYVERLQGNLLQGTKQPLTNKY